MRIRYGHLRKRGTVWYIIYREDGRHKWVSTGCTRKDAAETFRAELMKIVNARDKESELRHQADILANERNANKSRSVSLEDVWKLFEESTFRREICPRTLNAYRTMWDEFVSWIRKNHPKTTNIYQITDTLSEDYFRDVTHRVGNSTYNIKVRILSYIFKTIGKRIRLENHFERIPSKRHSAESRRELTADELKMLLDTTTGWVHNLILLGIYTGLRLGDCCNLKWSEVKGNVIVLQPQKTIRTHKTIHVPIHPQLQTMLDALPHKSDYVIPEAAHQYARKSISLTLRQHFAQIAGHSRTPNKDETIKRNVIIVSFHSLRHTFVSICKNAGVPDAVVMSIVGHGNSSMTRHYTHIGDDSARAAIAKIPTVGTDLAQPAELSREEIIRLLEQMTPDTWQEIRQQIIGA